MATFSFSKVNRIITVAAPTTEVTIQELINTIRDWEDELVNIDVAKIADASGKEDLGGGLQVGITLKLFNWRLKFEARPGPDWVDCSVTGGNLVAVNGSDQPMNPIQPSAYVTVTVIKAVSAALIADVAEWSQAEKDEIFATVQATPSQVWGHSDRMLTSRDIDSPIPGEHLPSEEQVQDVQAILDAIKGLGFESTEDALRIIRQLVQAGGGTGGVFSV